MTKDLMSTLQIGQIGEALFVIASPQLKQAQIWPQGINTEFRSASMHTTHFFESSKMAWAEVVEGIGDEEAAGRVPREVLMGGAEVEGIVEFVVALEFVEVVEIELELEFVELEFAELEFVELEFVVLEFVRLEVLEFVEGVRGAELEGSGVL
jgi:hypothetical protein